MKKILLLTLCAVIFCGTTFTATAQKDKLKNNKHEEIIIRRQGGKDIRLTVEMKDEGILINGKPLSEFNDSNITVIKRKGITYNGNDMLLGARGGSGGNSFFYNDDNEEESRPLLGVTTEKNDRGAKINEVSKGSAAEKAGLKEGDIITKIGDKNIDNPEDLVDAVNSYKPKNEVRVFYERNGKANDTKAVLGERKESRLRSFSFNEDGMPPMEGNMMKDFNFDMPPVPPMPAQPFLNFRMPQNKKLGVKIEDADNGKGAKITNVAEGSPAEKAGLKKDDIITEVDGEEVKNTGEVREKVLENEKSNYTIKANRGSSEMSFEIKIPKKINSINL